MRLRVRVHQLIDPFDQVKKTMNLGRIKVNPTFYRVNLGLKYLF